MSAIEHQITAEPYNSLSDASIIGSAYYDAILHPEQAREESKPVGRVPDIYGWDIADEESSVALEDLPSELEFRSSWGSAIAASGVANPGPFTFVEMDSVCSLYQFILFDPSHRLIFTYAALNDENYISTAAAIQAARTSFTRTTFVPNRHDEHFDLTWGVNGLYIQAIGDNTLKVFNLVLQAMGAQKGDWQSLSASSHRDYFTALLATVEGEFMTYLITDWGKGHVLSEGTLETILFNYDKRQMIFRFSSKTSGTDPASS